MSDVMSGTNTPKAPTYSKVWNLPNILTYGRIVAVPVVAGLLMWDTNTARWIALGIFIVAAITDFLDGYLARKWQQQSSLGRMLDPIADKVLVAVVLLVLSASPILYGGHLWAAIIILSREVLVSGLREYLGELQVSVPVTKIAKWKTTTQMVAISVLFLGTGLAYVEHGRAPMVGEAELPGGMTWSAVATFLGLILIWIAAGLTAWTGWDYFRKAMPFLRGPK